MARILALFVNKVKSKLLLLTDAVIVQAKILLDEATFLNVALRCVPPFRLKIANKQTEDIRA